MKGLVLWMKNKHNPATFVRAFFEKMNIQLRSGQT